MPRQLSIYVVALSLVLIALPASAAAAPSSGTQASASSEPEANASRACSLSRREQSNLGTTYVYTLRVSGTTCANGKKVVRAYHACRRRNGGRDGRCRSTVFGYRCSERRSNVIRTQYDARAGCKKSGREISHRYTQNT